LSSAFVSAFAALLGDPDCPKIFDPAQRGERILRFQELYRQYFRLELSLNYDRPAAIGSLQKRLVRTMGVNGGWGVLEDGNNKGLLRRSLLWHCGKDMECLNPIDFPTYGQRILSWSWMSVTSGIDYFQLDWNAYDWQNIHSPRSLSKQAVGSNVPGVTAHSIDLSAAARTERHIVFDNPAYSNLLHLMAVVFDIEKPHRAIGERRQYVLVIRKKVTSIGRSSSPVRKGWDGSCSERIFEGRSHSTRGGVVSIVNTRSLNDYYASGNENVC
jgi:hypothetical protein